METFKVQIEDLIGSVGDDTLISSSIQDVGAEIISVAPLSKLKDVTKNTAITSGGLSIGAKKIIAVDKGDYTAREIPATDKARYKSTASIYAGSDTSPVFYVEGQSIFVIGAAATGETSGTLHFVPIVPTSNGTADIVHGSDSIEHFPKEAIRLLVVGGAMRCLHRMISDIKFSTMSLPVNPSPPSLSSNSISFTTTAPVYTAPLVAPSFSTVDTYIATDEDVELAGIKIQEINTQISEYQANIQNQLNIFNDANVEYQAELQRAIENARLSSQDDAQLLQKYQLEVQDYQGLVNAEVQKQQDVFAKDSADFQFKTNQYGLLSAEYMKGLQLFMGGSTPQGA
jgi:hypothetical protein